MVVVGVESGRERIFIVFSFLLVEKHSGDVDDRNAVFETEKGENKLLETKEQL